MTEVLVTVTEATVNVTAPTAATVSAVTATDTVVIDGPDWHYLQGYDVGTQTAANTTTVYTVRHNTLDGHYGITNNEGVFTFSKSGTYSVTFSVQWQNAQTSEVDANIFLKKNGQTVADSNSRVTLPKRHGQNPGAVITTVNFIMQFVANDTMNLSWQVGNVGCTIQSFSAVESPEIPVAPGVITTIMQVS